MNEMNIGAALAKLLDCLSKRWEATLTRLGGSAISVSMSDDPPAEPDAQALWVGITFDGMITGEGALVMSSPDLEILSSKVRSAPGYDPAENPGTAAVEALRQSFIMAINDFQAQHGHLIAQIQISEAPTWTPTQISTLQAALSEGAAAISVSFLCGPNLKISAAAVTGQPGMESVPQGTVENLDLVMDAALEVALRFGQQQLTLAELAKLGPGSIVELDRKIQEPVELVLGGRVLARGEVMVVDGNYGLRVTELVERS
jgi:flagellar motor switch protein FliN/FliY